MKILPLIFIIVLVAWPSNCEDRDNGIIMSEFEKAID